MRWSSKCHARPGCLLMVKYVTVNKSKDKCIRDNQELTIILKKNPCIVQPRMFIPVKRVTLWTAGSDFRRAL